MRSFDIVGDVGIIEAGTKAEEKELVKKLLETHPRLKSVVRKESETKGIHRLKDYRIVYRDNSRIRESELGATETIHSESGCRYKLDVRKVFFNNREGTERQRIAEMVRPGEKVLVMFSGVGPYAVVIARHVNCEVVCVELNPAAVRYAIENFRLNKVQDKVSVIQGDVEKADIGGKFDRIVMPLGKTGYMHLETAIKHARKGAVLHVYGLDVAGEEAIEKEIERVRKAVKVKLTVMGKQNVLPYAPGKWKVRVDVKVA